MREVIFGGANEPVSYRSYRVPVYERGSLEAGAILTGPAIITQYDTTTVLPPDWRARVDAVENLLIEQTEEETGVE